MISILTDVTKCIGCNECVMACKYINKLPPDEPRRWQRTDGLSSRNWTSIIRLPENHYVRKQCRHCLEPACVSACPVGALKKTPEGAVIYDDDLCMGCRYCMMACPFDIPRYEWNTPVPYVRKCILCFDRVKEGEEPACTKVCPKQATIFGNRDELLAEAKRRLQAEPNKYIQHIYGEHEVGGTNVLYISDINLDFLTRGQKLANKSLPDTTKTAMHSVPYAFVGMGALMVGLNWIIDRRKKLNGSQKDGEEENDSNKES